MFIGSPLVRSLYDLEVRAMKFSEIPIHDVTRDLILMNFSNVMGYSSYIDFDDPNSGMYGLGGPNGKNGLGSNGGNKGDSSNSAGPNGNPNGNKGDGNGITHVKPNRSNLKVDPIVMMYGSNIPGKCPFGNGNGGDGSNGNDMLKYMFLPSGIADLLKSGKGYEARE